MALRDRIFSLETEYAISFYSDSERKPGAGTMVDVLMRAAAESHGIPTSDYLLNGSKLAHDVGHAEWSLPECRSAREAARYDKAADHLFAETVVPRAEKRLAHDGFVGRLAVTKNNADTFGNTYGCHENYQMKRDADLLMGEDFVRYVAQAFVPFLVTRQILAGSGHLTNQRVFGGNGQNIRYELSQRAGFIQTVVSRDTTRSRSIFNLGREGESFTTGNYRRLHLIVSDANMSGWATWIKLGSTGLMLRLAEDLFFDEVPVLRDPVNALKAISRDPAAKVPLQNGDQFTALDIQWMYYDLADAYLSVFGAASEDEELMEEWGKALEDFEQDPMRLRDRADWAIKRHMLDTFLQQHGLTMNEPVTDAAIITELQAFNLRYHELSPDGLYRRVYPVDTLLTAEEIARAQEYPPPYTRARIRGEVARLVKECGLQGGADRWTDVHLENERLAIADPLEFDHPRLAQWDRPWALLEESVQREPDDETQHYRLGKAYQSAGLYQRALVALRTAVERKPDNLVHVYDLARTLLMLGLYDEAIRWYEKYNQLVMFDDQYIRDEISIGDAYRLAGDDQKAFQTYRKAVRGDSIIAPLAYGKMALAHLKRGEVQSAETYFKKSLETSTERLITWVGLGAIHAARGEVEQARTCFRDALALPLNRAILAPTESAVRYFRAVAHIGLAHENAPDALDTALENQTAEAAEGIYAGTPLLKLLAESPTPPQDARAALQRVQDVRILIDQPDSAEPPVMLDRRAEWLDQALSHPNDEIRSQAITYLTWRFDEDRFPALDRFITRLIELAQNDHEPRVRRATVIALAHPKLAGRDLTNALIQCLQDDCLAVRWAAEAGLVQRSQQRAFAPDQAASVLFGERDHDDQNEPAPVESEPGLFDDFFDVEF
jgi:proteasome accessory factor A